MRGFCLVTSTVGWRTLQQLKGSPLPWAADLNGDGRAELIIWDSFSLREGASQAEFGLVAWVYQVDPKGVFTIDWGLSRQMARELASAYWQPLKPDASLQALRITAAQALEAFASERCTCERRE